MRVSILYRGVGICALLGLSCLADAQQSPTFSLRRTGPDLLQTLGVGSRAVAMGDAFSAIGDDASATFWNPGRLGFIPRREFMLEYRSVVGSTSRFTNVNGALTSGSAGDAPGKPQLGFASIVFPLTKHATKVDPNDPNNPEKRVDYLGTIGISYTLGGYLTNTSDSRITSDTPGIDPLTGDANVTRVTTTDNTSRTVRNTYLTFAFGKDFAVGKHLSPSRIGFGIGIYFINQEFSTDNATVTLTQSLSGTLTPQGLPIVNKAAPFRISERGQGFGVNIGLSYDPRGKSPWRLGMSYRTGAKLSFPDRQVADPVTGTKIRVQALGPAFNTETPDRFSLGAAYTRNLPTGQFVLSTEFQVFSAANRGLAPDGSVQLDRRRAVSNFLMGMEYTPKRLWFDRRGDYGLPLRVGFRTNANAATLITSYDNVISFGFALRRTSNDKLIYSIEPAAEVFTSNGLAQYTLTGRLAF